MAKSSQKDMEQLPALSPLELNRFIARLGVQPPKDAYPAKNTIGEIITPERQGWKKPESVELGKPTNGPAPAPTSAPANAIARPQCAG